MSELDKSQILYRFWQDNNLLYIGITEQFFGRMDQHSTTKAWIKQTTHVTLQHFANRPSVEQAEKAAILAEKPLFNVIHNTKTYKDPARIEKLREIMPENYLYVLPDTPQERRQFIHSLKTERGGYTRETLQKLGVKYPPNKKWMKNLVNYGVPYKH